MTEPRDAELDELLEEVHQIEVLAKRLVTEMLAGGYSSAFRGAGIEFDEVREYIPGDDPRSIDWHVTARVGTPHVKKYVDERELTVMFLLDLSASMRGGFAYWSLRQMAARVCACLAFAATHNDDKIGLVAFGDEVEHFVPPRKGSGQALRIIRDCLALDAVRRETRLAAGLEFASRAMPRRTVLFLLSDFVGGDWQDAITACAQRHDLVAVRLLPPELEPPRRGMMRVQDPETGRRGLVDWGHAPTRDAYLERVATWQRETAQRLRRAGVDNMDVPLPKTRDPDALLRPLVEFFRMRALRGGS